MSGGLYFGPAAWRPEKWEVIEKRSDEPTARARRPLNIGELLKALQDADIGKTGNVVPALAGQLETFGARVARAVVLDMIPTQPESAIPYALSHFAMAEMVAGFKAMLDCIPHRAAMVAVDRHDRGTTRRWRAALRKAEVSLRPLLNTYPQAHPSVLLWVLLGVRLREEEPTTSAGAVVVDPVTCWALGRYLQQGRTMRERPVQIFSTDQEPRLVLAPVGVTVAALLDGLGVRHARRQCILNGMLRGNEVDPGLALVENSVHSISLRPWPETETVSDCIRCGWCVDHCPTALNPAKLFYLTGPRSQPNSPDADVHESLNCIGCGLCSYVCPSRLPLTEHIVSLRGLCREEWNKKRTDVEAHG